MNTEKVIKRDQKYIMHTYARSPLVLEHGEGMYAYDADGKAYLDFTSGIGVNALGYCHPAWVQAVTMQATRLQHSSNLYYTAPCGKLAKRLCARTGLDQVFFGNSGAEANEGAIKCARKYSVTTYGPDRNKVLTLVNSFHGRTLATLTATGQDVFHKDFGPFPANFGYIPANDFDTFKAAVDDSVCAVMMEMVQGEGGGEDAAEQDGYHAGADGQQHGVQKRRPEVCLRHAAGEEVNIVDRGIAGGLPRQVGVDGAGVDLEGILHDGDDRRDGGKGQNDAKQKQNDVVRLGKEGLDLIEDDGGPAGAEGGWFAHGFLLFSQV